MHEAENHFSCLIFQKIINLNEKKMKNKRQELFHNPHKMLKFKTGKRKNKWQM